MSGYKWVHLCAGEPAPRSAVVGGLDCDGCKIYVGRAHHECDMIPAKVMPDKGVAYVAYNGQEHPKPSFEILVQSEFTWEFNSHGAVSSNAVVGGHTVDGECLYIGRAFHNGSQTVGKVQPSHGCLYISFGGEEISFKDYEVLCFS